MMRMTVRFGGSGVGGLDGYFPLAIALDKRVIRSVFQSFLRIRSQSPSSHAVLSVFKYQMKLFTADSQLWGRQP